MPKVQLEPPPQIKEFGPGWTNWLHRLFNRTGDGPFLIRGYTVATVPDATKWGDTTSFSSIIYVTNEAGGATLAFSDGTNWRRFSDRAIIS